MISSDSGSAHHNQEAPFVTHRLSVEARRLWKCNVLTQTLETVETVEPGKNAATFEEQLTWAQVSRGAGAHSARAAVFTVRGSEQRKGCQKRGGNASQGAEWKTTPPAPRNSVTSCLYHSVSRRTERRGKRCAPDRNSVGGRAGCSEGLPLCPQCSILLFGKGSVFLYRLWN